MTDVHTSYVTAGFGGEVGFGKRPAVILVDAARAYIEPDAPLYVGNEDAFLAMIELIRMARAAKIPIFFSRVEYMPGGADGGLFYKKVDALGIFQKGMPLGDFDDRLRPQPQDVIVTKQYASAFFGTSLASTLRAFEIDTCLLAGFSTSGCVRATTLDALQNGFRPILVTDACGDRDPKVQAANLFDLGQKYADLKSLGEIDNYLAMMR